MAFKLDDDADAYSDINVTPLVDVMLVLLVIFMVTTPLLHQGIDVKLPKSVAQNLPKTPEDPLILSITKSQLYYLNETPIPKAQLRDRVKLILKNRRDKAVYLTFDEAYEMGTTARIVGILDRAHVKATFFVTGQYVRANPALTRRLAAHGEVVGNHTGTHADMVLKARDRSAFSAELRATERAYRAATGRPLARLFRPPFGRYSARVLQLAGELGYTTVFWSFAHGDYDDDSQPPASVTLRRLLDAGYPGALYLLHASSRSNVAALAAAIRGLKARGFRFGTLDELAAV